MFACCIDFVFAQTAAPAASPWWDGVHSWSASGGSVLLAIGLVLTCTAAWLLNLVTLPGNWIAVACMALYAWWGPDSGVLQLGVSSLAAAFALGLLGEGLEFVAGAWGASRAGASRRATVAAIVGSVIGAITGGVIGLPIPFIGPLLAAFLFGGLGATVGAMGAEWNRGRPWRENWRIGQAAFWGRTVGTAGKLVAGLAIVGVCVLALLT